MVKNFMRLRFLVFQLNIKIMASLFISVLQITDITCAAHIEVSDVAEKPAAIRRIDSRLINVASNDFNARMSIYYLLAAGADINAKDHWGDTALRTAAVSSSWNVQKLLALSSYCSYSNLCESLSGTARGESRALLSSVGAFSEGEKPDSYELSMRAEGIERRQSAIISELSNNFPKVIVNEIVKYLPKGEDYYELNLPLYQKNITKELLPKIYADVFRDYQPFGLGNIDIELTKHLSKDLVKEVIKYLPNNRDVFLWYKQGDIEQLNRNGFPFGRAHLLECVKRMCLEDTISNYNSGREHNANLEDIELLLANKATPNFFMGGFTSTNNKTPLLYLVSKGYKEAVDLLLKYKADPNIQCKHRSGCYGSMCWELCDIAPIISAVQNKQTKIVKSLLAAKTDFNIRDDKFEKPILCAANNGSLDILKLLIDAGDDVNTSSKNKNFSTLMCEGSGISLLMCAVLYSRLDMINYLISKGAKLDDFSGVGFTPLMYACNPHDYYPKCNTCESNTDHMFWNNNCPQVKAIELHRKKKKSLPVHLDIVRTLLDAGANINLQNGAWGRTAHSVAKDTGRRSDMLKILDNEPKRRKKVVLQRRATLINLLATAQFPVSVIKHIYEYYETYKEYVDALSESLKS